MTLFGLRSTDSCSPVSFNFFSIPIESKGGNGKKRARAKEEALMPTGIKPSTVRTLAEIEQEMTGAQRMTEAEAIREALAALVRPARGWLSTGQAADRLGVTVPTVKEWIRRGTLEGQPVGGRW